jgi:hypothetical protein
MRLPCVFSMATNRGNAESIESRSGSPAWMPARRGSPMRSTVSWPKWRRRNDAIDSSAAPVRGRLRISPAIRSFAGQEKSRVVTMGSRRVGTPSIIPSGSGCRRPRWRTKTAL